MTTIAADLFTFSCAGVGGEWKRIANFNICSGDDCPNRWSKSSYNDISFYTSPSNNGDCYLTNFSTNYVSYQRACGRVRGYHKGTPDTFRGGTSIDDVYVERLTITHGSPRKHVWSYAIGHTELGECSYSVSMCSITGTKFSFFCWL